MWMAYVLVIAVVGIVLLWSRSRSAEETQPSHYDAPLRVSREDFPDNTAETLVVVFTSRVCDSCHAVWNKAAVVASDAVDVVHVEYEDEVGKKLHAKYDIQAVPTVIICDSSGTTHKAYLGSVTATDLWAGVASVRGSVIGECANH